MILYIIMNQWSDPWLWDPFCPDIHRGKFGNNKWPEIAQFLKEMVNLKSIAWMEIVIEKLFNTVDYWNLRIVWFLWFYFVDWLWFRNCFDCCEWKYCIFHKSQSNDLLNFSVLLCFNKKSQKRILCGLYCLVHLYTFHSI